MIYKTFKTVRIWPRKLALEQYLTPLLKMAMVGQNVQNQERPSHNSHGLPDSSPPRFSCASQTLYSCLFCWHIINLVLVVGRPNPQVCSKSNTSSGKTPQDNSRIIACYYSFHPWLSGANLINAKSESFKIISSKYQVICIQYPVLSVFIQLLDN